MGGIAGAAELPITLLYSSDVFFGDGLAAVLFVIGIPLGALLGVFAGQRLIEPQCRQPLGESYPYALGFGIPASLTFGCVMSFGGPIEVGAWLLGIYTCVHWIALAIWAAIARKKPAPPNRSGESKQ